MSSSPLGRHSRVIFLLLMLLSLQLIVLGGLICTENKLNTCVQNRKSIRRGADEK